MVPHQCVTTSDARHRTVQPLLMAQERWQPRLYENIGRPEDRNAPPLQFELFVEDAFFKVVFRIEQQGHRLLA